MSRVKILEDYGSAEGYKVGDVVDITDPSNLIAEGKVELAEEGEKNQPIEPVSAEPVVEAPAEAPVEPEVEAAPAEISSVIEETPVVEVETAPEGSDVV